MERVETRAANDILEIGAGEARGLARHITQIDIVGQRHVLRMDAEDLFAARPVGRTDIDQFVEAPRT